MKNGTAIGRPAAWAGAAALLALALAAPSVAAPARALAADGSVAIASSGAEYEPTYSAFQVFEADIGPGDKAAHVAWPDDDTEAAVLAYLDANGYAAWRTAKGYTATGAREVAQNALEFASEAIEASARADWTSGSPKVAAGNSFAAGLARAVVAADLDSEDVRAGQTLTAPEGYYLITSKTLATGATGTAPIWLALGGDTSTIAPKGGAVSATKVVKAAGDSGYALSTDSPTGAVLDYRVTATLPANLGAFESFRLELDDRMSHVGLEGGDLGTVTVKVDGADVTSALDSGAIGSISQTAAGFKVVFDDLLTAPAGVTKDSVVTIDYKARGEAREASDGGWNYVTLRYSKDPSAGDQMAYITSNNAWAYSYRLWLTKVDKSNGAALAGAKYTVRVRECPDDAARVGKYVQGDGTLAASPYEFVTGDDGKVFVGGLDKGTYTLHETAAPARYQVQDSDVVVKVTPTIDQSRGALIALATELSGGEAADVAGDEHTRVTASDHATHTASILMADDREISVPVTGLEGTAGLYAAAGILAACGAAGAAALLAGRRRGEGDE